MKKIRVWWDFTDACNAGGYRTIEVSVDATETEIEKAAREIVFEHFEWGFEEVQDD